MKENEEKLAKIQLRSEFLVETLLKKLTTKDDLISIINTIKGVSCCRTRKKIQQSKEYMTARKR